MKNIILREVRFSPQKVRLNITKLEFINFISFGSSLQSEVRKIILVKSSLREVRFNPRELILPTGQISYFGFKAVVP